MTSVLGPPSPHRPALLTVGVDLIARTATLPWRIFLAFLSKISALILSVLAVLGVSPADYIPASKLDELTGVLEHMHQREDVYRRALRELHEQLDQRDMDRKKALRRLKASKDEATALESKLTTLQKQILAGRSSGFVNGLDESDWDKRPPEGRLLMHATFLALAGAVWWFASTEHPSLQWKLVFSCFFPMLWAYVSWAMDRTSAAMLSLLCPAWCLLGVVVSYCVTPSPC